jgi:hypothetical protein
MTAMTAFLHRKTTPTTPFKKMPSSTSGRNNKISENLMTALYGIKKQCRHPQVARIARQMTMTYGNDGILGTLLPKKKEGGGE